MERTRDETVVVVAMVAMAISTDGARTETFGRAAKGVRGVTPWMAMRATKATRATPRLV
jgi:hypothetical protein